MKAAFQGVHGAYSELASKQLLGAKTVTIPCETFEDVFNAVAEGKADRGILPIENSLAGSIHQNYDLLLARNLQIVGEAHLKVEHVLMCHPSATLKLLDQVRSHPQALAQCSQFFAKTKRIKPVIFFDTAGAAESLVKEAPKNIGAIASSYAAELYGLKVLKRNLQNQPNNFTRFLSVAKAPVGSSATAKNVAYKTSIAFMPKLNEVGSLFNILGVFALRDIDLLKIESRPNPLSPFEYWFYIDFAGKSSEGLRGKVSKTSPKSDPSLGGDPRVDQALARLREMASHMKILGSYPSAVSDAGGKHKANRKDSLTEKKGR